MITRVVGPEHAIARGEIEEDHEDEFWENVLPNGGADGAVLARERGRTIGWLRFYWSERSRTLTASGTWVDPAHRNKGIAQRVWNKAMKHLKPSKVVVTTVTKEGRHLVGSIVRWFPKVAFDVR